MKELLGAIHSGDPILDPSIIFSVFNLWLKCMTPFFFWQIVIISVHSLYLSLFEFSQSNSLPRVLKNSVCDLFHYLGMKLSWRPNSYKIITSFLSLKHRNMMVNSLGTKARLPGIKYLILRELFNLSKHLIPSGKFKGKVNIKQKHHYLV